MSQQQRVIRRGSLPPVGTHAFTRYKSHRELDDAGLVWEDHDYWKELPANWKENNDADIVRDKKKHIVEVDVGKGMRTYSASVLLISFDDGSPTRCFYSLNEKIDKAESRRLAPFCPCDRCSTWIPFAIFFVCGCCVGCLHEEYNVPDHIVKRARETFDSRRGVPYTFVIRYWLWIVIAIISAAIFGVFRAAQTNEIRFQSSLLDQTVRFAISKICRSAPIDRLAQRIPLDAPPALVQDGEPVVGGAIVSHGLEE